MLPDSFSASRPIAIRAKAVDWVEKYVSPDRFFDTRLACFMASCVRFMSRRVSRIMASSRSGEPYIRFCRV